MDGPGFHPGMARKAEAGPTEAGSAVVATTRVTMASWIDRRKEKRDTERKGRFSEERYILGGFCS